METVTRVLPRDDFHLEIWFNTGEHRLFDARPYLGKGFFNVCRMSRYSSRLLFPWIPSAGRESWISRQRPSTTVLSLWMKKPVLVLRYRFKNHFIYRHQGRQVGRGTLKADASFVLKGEIKIPLPDRILCDTYCNTKNAKGIEPCR